MSDLAVFVLCAAVAAGAWIAAPVPVAAGAVVAVVGLLGRRPAVLVVGAGLLATGLGAAAWSGLDPPPPAHIEGGALLVSDPETVNGAVRVDLSIGGRRVEAWARGAPAAALRQRLGGEAVVVRGQLRPVPDDARAWLVPRHIAARFDVQAVRPWSAGSLAARAANGLRRTMATGAEVLEPDHRSLLLGVVIGDDREQSDELEEAFRGAGLTHLLAVSGSNVALVLALARPLLERLGLRGRWAATLALIGFFGLLTRWEPSVLRASAMAALACTSFTVGRPASRLRLLALAVSGAVMVDPLLVHALGFQLSVGATAGIALLAGPLARVRGPRWLVEPLAVTVAAQIGVAPIAIPAFGGVPLASLPANLLAGPAAGPLTAWGLTSGVLAGVAGPPFDAWLHVPTSWLTGWLAGVARWADSLPLGDVRAGHAIVAGFVAGGVMLVRRRRAGRAVRR